MKLSSKTQRIALCALFTSVSIIFGYIEFLIPFNFGIPGVKLGLANLIVVVLLYVSDLKTTVITSALRIFISALLFGSFYSFLYSLIGGILSLTVMSLIKRIQGFTPIGVSISGGVAHNIGQLLVAFLTFGVSEIFFYLPILLIAGALTGGLIGVCSLPVIKKLNKIRTLK